MRRVFIVVFVLLVLLPVSLTLATLRAAAASRLPRPRGWRKVRFSVWSDPDISPALVRATIGAEDANSARITVRLAGHRKRLRETFIAGACAAAAPSASQTAKNVVLTRTELAAQGLEAYLTVMIEVLGPSDGFSRSISRGAVRPNRLRRRAAAEYTSTAGGMVE